MNTIASASRFSLKRFKIGLALTFAVLGAGCATREKLTSEPTLVQAERRLVRAEKLQLNAEGQAAEFVVVAKICAGEMDTVGTATSAKSSQALALYNRAVANLATDLPGLMRQKNNSSALELRDASTGETSQLDIEFGKPGEYQPASFREILNAAGVNRKGLDQEVTRPGVGGTVVGLQQSLPSPRLEPPKGYRFPVTAVVDFPKSSTASAARLRLFDPNKVNEVELEGLPVSMSSTDDRVEKPEGVVPRSHYPLAADFSAPLASYGRINENWIGFLNMVRGERMRGGSGLLMMRPYDPTRIPVIFVHGLLSSAYVWRNVVNTLSADPEIRLHYQFWVFSYSTGNPIAYSAYLLRDDLEYAEKLYGFKQAILIGHSMGGILSRMQATNAGRVIWDAQFKEKADKIYADIPADSLVKRSLIFKANPTIKRIVFVSTPHRGSTLATGGIGALGMRLIRLPFKVAAAMPKSVLAAVSPNNDSTKFRLPTSISGLSPSNPLFKALDNLPIEAPHNSIIGDRGKGDTPKSSDGVVPYWSSHLDSAQSEVIVPTDHGAMKSPKAVAEIRRILLFQIGAKPPKRPVGEERVAAQ